MDFTRPPDTRRFRRRVQLTAAVAVAAVLLLFGIAQVKPGEPVVDRASIWTDKVKRGAMLREVRGTGTLVAEDFRWIPATTDARVERIVAMPGVTVAASSVILELSNPEVDQSAMNADLALRVAESELTSKTIQLESELLSQRATYARVHEELEEARLRLDIDEELARQGLTSTLNLKLSRARAADLTTRSALEEQRVKNAVLARKAQIVAFDSHVAQLRNMAALRRKQRESLLVRAGLDGVLQQIAVQVGQRVSSGVALAKVARPEPLRAELRVPETQARDVQIGQHVSVDTRNGIAAGTVRRIDPAAQNGTVLVEVSLSGPMPRGVRPDLTVDGAIQIDRLADVLHIARPVQAEEDKTVRLFRITGESAVAVNVRIGRAAVNAVEIVSGVNEGDEMIVSDTSAWSGYDRIRLK